MKMKFAFALVLFGLISGNVIGDAFGEFKFSEKQKKNKYYKDFAKWAKEDKTREPGGDAVLCIGSSSMRGWKDIKKDLAPLNVIHRGFGGSTMGQVLFWKDFFLRYKANTVVIYEGDNDLASPKSNINKVVGRFKEFCSELLKSNPKTKIYIISVKPSVRRAARWKAMSEANELLKKYAESNPQITFIDASSKMLKEDGTPREDILKKDKLHMTRKGYDIWKEAVRKELIK